MSAASSGKPVPARAGTKGACTTEQQTSSTGQFPIQAALSPTLCKMFVETTNVRMIAGCGSEVHIAVKIVLAICHGSFSSVDSANCRLVHDAGTTVSEPLGSFEQASSQRGLVALI